MLQAVIYDMDGVLINSEPLWREAEKVAFAKVGVQLTDADCKLTMGFRTNEVIDFWWERHPWEGLTKNEVEQAIISGVTNLIAEQGQPIQGVVESLEFFKKNNFKIGLASSSPMKLIEAVIAKLEIKHFFDVVHSAQFEEYGKPHPAVYLTAAKMLQVKPQSCLVIEDSIHGMNAGLAANMKVIAIPDEEDRGNTAFKKADLLLESLTQISNDLINQAAAVS